MSKLDLYLYPRACSGVTLCALEELGLEYDYHVIDIFQGEQKHPDYLRIHRNGKVPALGVDGQVITENASILLYLHNSTPGSSLLPETNDPIERAQQVSDLVWCSSGLHPMVRQVRMPMRFTDGETSGIKAKGEEMFHDALRLVEGRVAGGRWWYGDAWSIMDMYLLWLTNTAASGGFSLDGYPKVRDLRQRATDHPSAKRARAIEIEAAGKHGLEPPPNLAQSEG